MPLTSHYRYRYRGKSPHLDPALYIMLRIPKMRKEKFSELKNMKQRNWERNTTAKNYGETILAVGNNILSINVYSYSALSLNIYGNKCSFIYFFIFIYYYHTRTVTPHHPHPTHPKLPYKSTEPMRFFPGCRMKNLWRECLLSTCLFQTPLALPPPPLASVGS